MRKLLIGCAIAFGLYVAFKYVTSDPSGAAHNVDSAGHTVSTGAGSILTFINALGPGTLLLLGIVGVGWLISRKIK